MSLQDTHFFDFQKSRACRGAAPVSMKKGSPHRTRGAGSSQQLLPGWFEIRRVFESNRWD